jgi:nucleotide-binding universal stress UspA family protein
MRILCAYDGSETGRRALEWTVRLARDEEGSTVSVIAVAASLEAAPHIPDAIDPTSSPERHQRSLAEAQAVLKEAGVQAETILKVGNPAEEIINAGEEGDFELIVVGRTGAGGAIRFLMGSVSDRVVRHGGRPVMVVH